jgi:hypothetical protein
MSQVAIVGLVVLIICCSSSSVMLTMGGGDDSGSSGSTGQTPGQTPTPTPTPTPDPYIVVDESHVNPLKAGYVNLGAGSSVEACRKLAYDADYAAFGWRKVPNTCWAIVDGEATSGKVVPKADHAVGCVAEGEDINTGCKTTKTNVLRARHYGDITGYKNIQCNSIDSCRTAAKAEGANHFGWREASGNGWVVTNPAISSTRIEFLANHTIGCTDPTKRPPNC